MEQLTWYLAGVVSALLTVIVVYVVVELVWKNKDKNVKL